MREPLKIHFGGQASLFDSGLRQKKQALALAKPDFSSLPEAKNLLLAAQLLELPLIDMVNFWIYSLLLIAVICCGCSGVNKTDVSLFMKSDSDTYLTEIASESGDLFRTIGHHGPAVENEWLGLRLYFDGKGGIDVYSKSAPGLELRKTGWYPTVEQQTTGWGGDYYKVGATVGLGSVRLWDGEKVVMLDPVTERVARVVKEGSVSFMEMRSEGVPYKGGVVDILVRVTVYSGLRQGKVEAFVLGGDAVEFVTGINYHEGLKVIKQDNYIATWGLHPEDVAAERIEVGGAIIYNIGDFRKEFDDGTQRLLISKPTRFLETWITSACAKEEEVNSMDDFVNHIKTIANSR